MISTSIHGIVQNGSVLFFDENTITIHCTISNPTYTVEWYYRTLIDGNVTDVTSLSILSPQTGISSLDVSSNQLGYYNCIINRDTVYTVYLVHNSPLSNLEYTFVVCIIEVTMGLNSPTVVFNSGRKPSRPDRIRPDPCPSPLRLAISIT